jgi:hypothetical protein
MADPQSDDMTITGWLVGVTPAQGGEAILFAAAFKSGREAEIAVRNHPAGRRKHILMMRPLDVGEMMKLRMKPEDIKRHD